MGDVAFGLMMKRRPLRVQEMYQDCVNENRKYLSCGHTVIGVRVNLKRLVFARRSLFADFSPQEHCAAGRYEATLKNLHCYTK
jgi:hypothetical protein